MANVHSCSCSCWGISAAIEGMIFVMFLSCVLDHFLWIFLVWCSFGVLSLIPSRHSLRLVCLSQVLTHSLLHSIFCTCVRSYPAWVGLPPVWDELFSIRAPNKVTAAVRVGSGSEWWMVKIHHYIIVNIINAFVSAFDQVLDMYIQCIHSVLGAQDVFFEQRAPFSTTIVIEITIVFIWFCSSVRDSFGAN